MLLPGRHGNSSDYRYGFQGQELDNEIKGEGNSHNYTFRMHDPRVGRFFAVDPLTKKYPNYSPYSFSGNKVINSVEREGLEETFYMIGFQENSNGDSHLSFIKVAEIDNQVETIFGTKIKVSDADNVYIFGSDGHWHLLPDSARNQSLYALGDTTEEIFAEINKGESEMSDKIASIAIKLNALEKIGSTAEAAIGTAYLINGFKNIRGIRSIMNRLRSKKSSASTGIAQKQIPQGVSREKFNKMSSLLKKRLGGLSDDVRIQGSRARGTARPDSDIDIGIIVTEGEFSGILAESFKTVNPGSARSRTYLNALLTGKISPGNAGPLKGLLRKLRKEVADELGMKVDLSIIRRKSSFDSKPTIKIK